MLNTEQVHTLGEQANKRTRAKTGSKPDQWHLAKPKQNHVQHIVLAALGTVRWDIHDMYRKQ